MNLQSIGARIRRYFAHHPPSALLLVSQLVLLVLHAIFHTRHNEQVLLSVSGLVILILLVWVVTRSPSKNWIAWMLAAPSVILMLLALLDPIWQAWSSIPEALLYFYAAFSLIVYMMGDTRVTLDELWAAGATFTLLAWGFGYAYYACEAFYPGSFLSIVDPGSTRSFLELLSLVFTNLTATGLSDLLPANPAARVLIMLTQFAGVGYVALVVSRLIGMTLTQRERRKDYNSR
jgi:hypothetical protein